MPPNRVTDPSTDDLTTLDVLKLVPAGPRPSCSSSSPPPPNATSTTAPTDSSNYWDWPVDETAARLEESEKARFLTSAAHVEKNLVQQAALKSASARHALPAQAALSASESSNSSTNLPCIPAEYWDMPSHDPTPQEVPAALYRHLQSSQSQHKRQRCVATIS